MINATENIKKALEERAHEESRPFCYGDYITVPIDEDGQAFCPKCGSDDLMREVPGVGVEYGYAWIAAHIVETEGEDVDIEEIYKDLLDEIYEPIKFSALEYSPSQVLEAIDPVAFNIGANEYADSLVEDGCLIESNGKYYRLDSVTE